MVRGIFSWQIWQRDDILRVCVCVMNDDNQGTCQRPPATYPQQMPR